MRHSVAVLLFYVWAGFVSAQGFAGLGTQAEGFARPERGTALIFPQDHGAHPQYRIEWWYLTANLRGDDGQHYGVQWTLFRSALAPAEQRGWASPQLWFAHAAASSADQHFSAERFARGGIGQAGVTADPFDAWIDGWSLSGDLEGQAQVTARGEGFGFDLQLTAEGPLVLHGEEGYSVKSEAGQASYYYSQPFFAVAGALQMEGRDVAVSGQAWLDREWSSQPLADDQSGWDWVSLHLDSGAKLMAFRLRQTDGNAFISGSWIAPDGAQRDLSAKSVTMRPIAVTETEKGPVPTSWALSLSDPPLNLQLSAINPQSWMEVTPSYWEGPLEVLDAATGRAAGRGYLEMTGYD